MFIQYTYLLTPWSRVLLEKLPSSQLMFTQYTVTFVKVLVGETHRHVD